MLTEVAKERRENFVIASPSPTASSIGGFETLLEFFVRPLQFSDFRFDILQAMMKAFVHGSKVVDGPLLMLHFLSLHLRQSNLQLQSVLDVSGSFSRFYESRDANDSLVDFDV